MILGRKRWTDRECSIFDKFWTPSSGKLPSKATINAIKENLPDRTVDVIRTRASNLLRKMTN